MVVGPCLMLKIKPVPHRLRSICQISAMIQMMIQIKTWLMSRWITGEALKQSKGGIISRSVGTSEYTGPVQFIILY
jgi:hypothetical protein